MKSANFMGIVRNNEVIKYNKNGALSRRDIITGGDNTITGRAYNKNTSVFEYDFRGLLAKLDTWNQNGPSAICFEDISSVFRNEWQYSYNPSGEREQKRLTYSVSGDRGGSAYAWENYLLGSNNEQIAVYQGVQQSDEAIAGEDNLGNPCVIGNPGCSPRFLECPPVVFFYPAEYNTYAVGGAPITWRTDSAGNWRKEYKLFDHLGSVRSVLRKSLTDNSYEYREQISYNPFGEVRERQYSTDNATPDARLKYIGKQMDFEMNLADHG